MLDAAMPPYFAARLPSRRCRFVAAPHFHAAAYGVYATVVSLRRHVYLIFDISLSLACCPRDAYDVAFFERRLSSPMLDANIRHDMLFCRCAYFAKIFLILPVCFFYAHIFHDAATLHSFAADAMIRSFSYAIYTLFDAYTRHFTLYMIIFCFIDKRDFDYHDLLPS